jgi:hypothetical protein
MPKYLHWQSSPEAEFLDEIQTKFLRVFLLIIHSRTGLPWDFYFYKLTQPLTVSVKEKGGKPDRKLYPLPYGLRNPYINLKFETLKIMPRNLKEIVLSWIRPQVAFFSNYFYVYIWSHLILILWKWKIIELQLDSTYDQGIDPSISNEFNQVYRFGHSLVPAVYNPQGTWRPNLVWSFLGGPPVRCKE